MSFEPWSAIIGQIVSGAARNMSQTKAGADKSESETYGVYDKNPQQGMFMQQGPAMENNAVSPTAQIMQATGGIPVSMQKQVPGVGAALKGEEGMLRNTLPSVGGYMQGPSSVNSDMPPYMNSALPDYLKRRGGFSL